MVFPELGESDKPLEENILKKKLEFIKTWVEFQGEQGEQVIRTTHSSSTVPTILFTVKKNETLFITSAWFISLTTGSDIFQLASLEITAPSRTSISKIFVFRHNTAIRSGIAPISTIFPMPLKIEQGNNIELVNEGSNITSSGGFTGFILSKRIT